MINRGICPNHTDQNQLSRRNQDKAGTGERSGLAADLRWVNSNFIMSRWLNSAAMCKAVTPVHVRTLINTKAALRLIADYL